MSKPMTKEHRAELRAECVSDWGGLSPEAGNEALDEIEHLERELRAAREALRWIGGVINIAGVRSLRPDVADAIDAARAAEGGGDE